MYSYFGSMRTGCAATLLTIALPCKTMRTCLPLGVSSMEVGNAGGATEHAAQDNPGGATGHAAASTRG